MWRGNESMDPKELNMKRRKVTPHPWLSIGMVVICFLLFLLFLSQGIFAQTTPPTSSQIAKKELTPEQALKIRSIGDLQLSPDGHHIAMTVTEPIKGESRNSDIWIYKTKSRQLIRFTTSEKSDNHPRWSLDGDTLAFLSSRKEKTQIYLISLLGGEAEALTDSKTSIQSFRWSPNGKQIVYMASEPKTEEEEKKQKEKDDARVVDMDDIPSRLWVMDVASRDVRQLTKGEWRISSFCWTPDGEHLIVTATDQNRPELLTDRLYSLCMSDGSLKEIAQPAQPFGGAQVSPDGKIIAYLGTRLDGPTAPDLYVLPLEGGKGGEAKNLTQSFLDRSVSSFKWQKNGNIVIQAADGFKTSMYEIDLEGHADRWESSDVDPSGSFVLGPDFVAFVGQTTIQMPELWISKTPGQAEKVSDLNAEWDDISILRPEIVTYESFDGKQIEAALLKPKSYQKGIRMPLIVLVHGGPAGRWSERFESWGQLLAQRGYAVLYPNVRGSFGYGHDFVTANRRDWGGGDFKDVMAGVDYVIERGIADPDRLGIGGWSYGGYMAAWAVTQTDRFKASVAGAPMTDLASEYGTELAGINAFDTWYMGTPYENLESFQERSPVSHVKDVKTPTLLLTGENDVIDPIGQCQQFYRGLRRYGVETEFVIYPREGHGIREERHRIDLLNRILAWFDKYIGN
jgi:dipeptidyl aminopeptidase/acylaminoacyl peptidase